MDMTWVPAALDYVHDIWHEILENPWRAAVPVLLICLLLGFWKGNWPWIRRKP